MINTSIHIFGKKQWNVYYKTHLNSSKNATKKLQQKQRKNNQLV